MNEYKIKRMHNTKYKILTLATIDMQENKRGCEIKAPNL
jgi:hypothetical protein